MGFNLRIATPLDYAVSPLLPQADASQPHDIPTGVSPTTAKIHDWIAWISANGVFFSGGTTINSDITINGDLVVTLTLDVAGAASFGSTVAVGTDLTVGDDLTVTDDATIGDDLTVGGDIIVTPARTWTRRCMRICNIYSLGMPGSPAAWVEGGASSSPPYVRFLELTSGEFHWIELEDLPHGGTISQVEIVTAGLFSTATIGAAANYTILRWQGNGAIQTMSASTSDTHTSGTWNNDISHVIAVTSNSTIDRSYRYALRVNHHQNVDAGADMVIKDVLITGTVSSIQV